MLLSILLSSACAATRPPRAMPLSLFTGHWGVVEMQLGAVHDCFILDTGTDHTTVDVGLARHAGWRVNDCVSLSGTFLGDLCRVALPPSHLKGRALPSVRGRTADMRHSDLGQMTDIDGMIGGDWLSRFVIVFDYPNSRWDLIEPATFTPPLHATTIPFSLQDNIIFLPVKIDGQAARFLLDTGTAGTPFVFTAPGQAQLISADEQRMVYRKGLHIAGGGDGDLVEAHATLELGDIRWPTAEVRVVPRGTGSGYVMEHIAGIIGVETLRWFRVTIDCPHRTLYLEQLLPLPVGRGHATFGILVQPHDGKLVVDAVAEAGPAALAGIHAAEQIRSVGGVPISIDNLAIMKWSLTPATPGESIALELVDASGATRVVRLTAIAAP